MNPGIYSQTPQLAVIDNRGLPVRQVVYSRRDNSELIPEARVTVLQHDAAGRLVAQRAPRFLAPTTRPNLKTVYSLPGAALFTDSIDAGWRLALPGEAGQVLERWDGRGSHWQNEFDEQWRPTAIHEHTEGSDWRTIERLTYAGNATEFAERNQCGRLIRHDDPAGTLLFEEFGLKGGGLEQTRHFLRELESPDWPELVADRDTLLEPSAGAMSRSRFNVLGGAIEQTDAKGHRQLFSQTVAGQLREVRLQLAKDTAPTTLITAIQYNAYGQTELEVAGNGAITTLEYAPEDGRLTRLQVKLGSNSLQDLRYTYDPVGNVLSIEDAAMSIRYFANQRIEPISRYGYDSLYQMIFATGWEAGGPNQGPQFSTFDDPVPCANYRQTYRYDVGSNLLELNHDGPQSRGHRLVAATHSNRCLPVCEGVEPDEEDFRKGFDANGNLLNLQPGQVLSWDLRDRLRKVLLVERDSGPDDSERYVYAADGMRVRKIRSTLTSAQMLIAEVRYLPSLEIRTHSGTGEVLNVISVQAGHSSVRVLHWESAPPKDSANDQYRYNLNDHLRSCTLELDSAGEVISQERYHPFGTTAWFAGKGEVEASYKTVRYSGKERDATGLYYYGFRYYVACWQRWLNPDPAGEVDGMNLYVMVRSNPVTLKDLDGRQSNFNELFKPARGDLIFGLSKAIELNLSWVAALTGRGDYLAKYFTGDDIATLEEGLNPVRDRYDSFRSMSNFMGQGSSGSAGGKSGFWGGLYQPLGELVGIIERDFYSGVKSKYSGWMATSANKKFAENYTRELARTDYSVRKTFEKFVGVDEGLFNQKLLSRASKAGLSTVLNSGRDDMIHFMLDGLDMEQVILKTRPSATSSELRYLFRNTDKLENKVNFYEGHQRVEAPWKKNPIEWSRYKPSRVNKPSAASQH
ncbi:toxin [Pseudomonas sp. N3-W]|uniref:RHS repeat-associated core domain-containing protein n=1 Tax=Pseudomonas sp. N3-W TaxID=2975049 RepID=UPI00217F2287|nr:RHS repeat-associated core domain-containing protein [Pseudomonas sp. N3-W]UWF52172.1 toxin [Pseudomonas sp. N3-W]